MTKSIKEKSRQDRIRLFENGTTELNADDIKFSIKHEVEFIGLFKIKNNVLKFKRMPFDYENNKKIEKRAFLNFFQTQRLITVQKTFAIKLENKIKQYLPIISKELKIYDWDIIINYRGMNNFLYNITYSIKSRNKSKKCHLSLSGFHEIETKENKLVFPKKSNIHGSFFEEKDLEQIEKSISDINGFSLQLYYKRLKIHSNPRHKSKKISNKIFQYHEKIKESGLRNIKSPFSIKYALSLKKTFFNLHYTYPSEIKNEWLMNSDSIKNEKDFLIYLISVGILDNVNDIEELAHYDFETIIDQLSIHYY